VAKRSKSPHLGCHFHFAGSNPFDVIVFFCIFQNDQCTLLMGDILQSMMPAILPNGQAHTASPKKDCCL
jgi:hypothetical protein